MPERFRGYQEDHRRRNVKQDGKRIVAEYGRQFVALHVGDVPGTKSETNSEVRFFCDLCGNEMSAHEMVELNDRSYDRRCALEITDEILDWHVEHSGSFDALYIIRIRSLRNQLIRERRIALVGRVFSWFMRGTPRREQLE